MESDKMDEELDEEVILGYDEECSRSSVLLELRELQLQAYASLVDAVRASGKLDEAKKNFMLEVRKYFDISDQRHQMECKRASLDPHLTRIAECLTGVDLKTSWRLEGTRTFPEPPLFRRMCRDLQELCRNSVKIPLPVCNESISTSASDAEAERDENSATENEVEKSQLPRTNTLPPQSVPADAPQPTEEVEIHADDKESAFAISVSFDPASAMEITADVDKNSIKTVPPQDLLTNNTDVKHEVLPDENNISNSEDQIKISTKPDSSNVEQDLKVKEENIENNIDGISPFLVSLLQERRNNSKPLDPRMSLLNYANSGNRKEIVHYEVVNGEEFGMAEKRWYQLEHRREQGVQTMPVSIVEDNDEYSSCEDDEELDYYNIKRERSPDITDTPTSTPLKQRLSSLKSSTNSKKGRGAKRKLVRRPSKMELPPVAKKVLKNAKQSKQVKNTKHLPKIKMFSKRRSSTDEDEDVQMESKEKSTAKVGRGRGLSKVRGRGTGRGRGHGRGRPPLNSNPASHASVASLMDSSNLLPSPQFDPAAATLKSPSPSRSPHLPSPSKPNLHNSGSTTKPLKAVKPKKNKPVSCSRRKSSLKAKEDDEMQVTWDDHDYEGAVIVRGNNLIPIRKRRSVSSNDTSTHSGDEHRRKERIYLNESPEDQYWNRGIIKRRISTNTGDEEDPDSLPFNDEETDSASENESERGEHHTPPGQNNNSTSNPHRARKSPSPSPPMQHPSAIHKQRLTTPTKMNSNTPGGGSQTQLPRITLPPPVFSTTLNETRSPKPVSVVDSLNLHLPITPTASSLAASSVVRRTPTVGGASSSSSSTGGSGCGIFSNSQALIANSRGTPGILQKQRKAQPHILSNSKAHQRTFIPTSNPSQNADNYTGETDYLILTLPNNL